VPTNLGFHATPDAPNAIEPIGAASLDRAMRTLEPELRVVIDLCYVQRRSYREAAAALGVPYETVAQRLRHGRARLRDLLGLHGPNGPHGPMGADERRPAQAIADPRQQRLLAEQHRSLLRRLAQRLCDSDEAVEQLVDEAVQRAAVEPRRGDDLAGWLAAILTQAFLDNLRRSHS
jgi:DNA-directed RNA polymerase specialized sigma24 family protein